MIEIAIGITGMVSILIAFVLDEFYKDFNQDTVQYNILNMFGAALLMYYAYYLKGWPFLVLNLVWLVVAGIKLVKIMKNSK